MYNNLSLLNIIGGLSKTLNIANQMIPIYKQVKPLISNSGKILSNLQNYKSNKQTTNSTNNSNKINNTNRNNYQNNMMTVNNQNYNQLSTSTSLPTFFL